MTPPQSNSGVRGLICHKKVRDHGYKRWRNLGSLTLYSHLSSVEDFTCSCLWFYIELLFNLTVISVRSVPEAIGSKHANSGCQKRFQ